MAVQRLHPSLAAINMLTPEELDRIMGQHFNNHLRERYRGEKLLDLPVISVVASGTTTSIAHMPPGQQLGPDEGFIWRLGRVTVSSSGTDTGAVTLYKGSDPTQTDPRHQIDNTLKIGQAYYPGSRGVYLKGSTFLYFSATTVASNTYVVTGQVVEVPAEMIGKII